MSEETWDAGWEVGFPAATMDEMLLALVVRDLVHGSSFDVEAEEDGSEIALDFLAGDELDGETYQLLLSAEVAGSENRDMVLAFTEEMLEGLVDEAQELISQRENLGSKEPCELEFKTVAEDDERWDLVAPDWLAPDGAEVPFGYRSFELGSEKPWPDNEALDAHGRVILVPFGGAVHAFGIPAPAEWGDEDEGPQDEGLEDEGLQDEGLKVHPDS